MDFGQVMYSLSGEMLNKYIFHLPSFISALHDAKTFHLIYLQFYEKKNKIGVSLLMLTFIKNSIINSHFKWIVENFNSAYCIFNLLSLNT